MVSWELHCSYIGIMELEHGARMKVPGFSQFAVHKYIVTACFLVSLFLSPSPYVCVFACILTICA